MTKYFFGLKIKIERLLVPQAPNPNWNLMIFHVNTEHVILEE